MSRNRINVFLTVAALACFVVGSTIAWSNIARSAGGQAYMTKVDFDQAFVDTTAMSRREYAPAFMTKVDFNQAFANPIGTPHRENTPAFVTNVDFDHTFANTTAMSRRENTPPNREKLRDTGWKRILGSL